MKIRTDFVTNSSSSSSSFILSRKGELTEAQKQAAIDFVEKVFLRGDEVVTKENFEQFCEDNYIEDEEREQMQKELDAGRTIHYGTIYSEMEVEDLYQKCWKAIEEAGPETFKGIRTDLCY